MKIEIAQGKRWIGRNQRLEKLKAEQTKPKPMPQNSNSTTSSSSKGGKQQPASQYMDVELYNAATMDNDDVDAFIEVLERVAAKKRYAFEDIFQQVSPSGNTLLHLASSHQNEKIVRLIVHHCPSLILKQNKKGDTALHLAVRSHASGIAKIEARIIEDWSMVIHTLLRFREDWLHPLASDEWIDAVRALPENVKLLRVRNEKGNTALHEALINQQEGAAFTLIEGDPEVSYFLNAEGESPLYLAAEAGYKRLVSSMLSDYHDFEIRNKEDRLKGKSPLQAAMIRRDIGTLSIPKFCFFLS